jgi:hypothetical protein
MTRDEADGRVLWWVEDNVKLACQSHHAAPPLLWGLTRDAWRGGKTPDYVVKVERGQALYAISPENLTSSVQWRGSDNEVRIIGKPDELWTRSST